MEAISRNGSRVPGFGLGEEPVSSPRSPNPSPWAMALATSVLGAATGWLIEEVAMHARGGRRRR